MTRKLRYTQAEVSRLIKGAAKAGKDVDRFEIEKNGKIIVILSKDDTSNSENEWDTVLR